MLCLPPLHASLWWNARLGRAFGGTDAHLLHRPATLFVHCFPAEPLACHSKPCSEFEVDFVTISYCRSAEDVFEAREFLSAIGQEHTKVRPASPRPAAGSVWAAQSLTGLGNSQPTLGTARPSHTSRCRCTHQPLLLCCPSFAPTRATVLQCSRQVIAKCETRQSLFNFRALVDASDAIIISRGNLGLDVVRWG